MRKLIPALIASTFAFASFGALAAAHGGAMTDAQKMEACKNMDPAKADDKMKAECKKMMEKK
ncbi:MAG: hypothetical protein ACI9M6_001251 [Hydrogenophaga sp.]|jgi:hypothetical protein